MSMEDLGEMSEVPAIDAEILHLLTTATEDWMEADSGQFSKNQAIALRLLVWSRLVELRLHVRAWGDGTSQVIRAECIVSGEYRKALPDEIRKAVPAFQGRVVAQPDPKFEYRLTLAGRNVRRDVADPIPMNRIILLAAVKQVLPARVTIRITDFDAAPSTGAVTPVGPAQAKVDDTHVAPVVPGQPTESSAPDATRNNEAPPGAVEKKKVDPGTAPVPEVTDRRRGVWPLHRAEAEVSKYFSSRQEVYRRLGQACLEGRKGAAEEFRSVFGPSQIARGINVALGISDEGAMCHKQAVSGTDTYKTFLRPLIGRSPRRPEGWVAPANDSGAGVQAIFDDISEAEKS
jgi:hypothetical protein